MRNSFVTTMFLALLAAATAWLCVALLPGPLPAPRDPRFADNVFDSRAVVWIARLLLVSITFVLVIGSAYVVASTIARMRNGEWLKRAGSFEVSETALAELEDQVRFWRSAVLDDQDEIEDLRAQLAESKQLIEQFDAVEEDR